MTTQSCVSRISRATSPYAVSLLSQSVPTHSPGSVMSAATSAPIQAARAGPFQAFVTDLRLVTRRFLAAGRGTLAAVRMLPISLRPNGRRAVIVGGGNVAARKAQALLHAGFSLFVVAVRIDDRLRSLLHDRGARAVQRCYDTGDLDGAALVIAATDDRELNARVVARRARGAHAGLRCERARARRFYDAGGRGALGELTIGVDSGGDAPAIFAPRRAGTRRKLGRIRMPPRVARLA